MPLRFNLTACLLALACLAAAQKAGHAIRYKTDGPNLIGNGDFSAGNVGFSSELGYVPPTYNCLWPSAYTIAPVFDDPQLHRLILSQDFAAPIRHSGQEQVMFINPGQDRQLNLWESQVQCKPNTRYRITFRSISLTPGKEWLPPYVIHVNSFRSITQQGKEGAYNAIGTEWTSGDETTAIISILKLKTPHITGIIGIANIEMREESPVDGEPKPG